MRKVIVTALFFFIFPMLSQVWAATFSLEPNTGSFSVGQTLSIQLSIDTQGQEIIDADAVFNYDFDVLEFVAVQPGGGFFPIVRSNDNPGSGVLRVLGTIGPTDSPKVSAGSEQFATLTFRAIKGGSAALTFSCVDGGLTDSNILAKDPNDPTTVIDLIVCTSLDDENGQYTVSDGGDMGGPNPTFPYETPVPGEPTCDLCGYCKGGDKPPNYDACKSCIVQDGRTWTPIGCVSTSAAGFVQAVLRFILPLAGGLAFLGILFGGFLLITSKGEPDRINQGKSFLIGSIGAILLILFGVFLLRIIGFEILGIPGFG